MTDSQEPNRFAPPNAQLAEPGPGDGTPVLANRSARLGAAMLDGLFAGVMALVVILPMYGWQGFLAMGRSPLHFFGALAINYAIYLGVQGWFLYNSGQTLGKKAAGLRIVRPDGSYAPIGRLLLRIAITTFAGLVPFLGRVFSLVDVLFIFGGARRCLHDYIADTVVMTAASTPHATREGAEGVHLRTANF